MSLDTVPAVKLFGTQHSLKEILYSLKIREELGPAIRGVVIEILLLRKAQELGLTVSDEELQQEADAFRKAMGLNKATDTQAWLAQAQLTVEDFETRIERGVLAEKVKEQLSAGKIEGYFSEQRPQFDRAIVSQIVVADEAVAEELAMQLKDEEAEWSELVPKSIDERSKGRDGSLGVVVRSDLSPAVQAAVFNAAEGEVVGPVKTDMGHHIIRVDELQLGELNEMISNEIRERICAEWLNDQLESAGAEVLLNDLV